MISQLPQNGRKFYRWITHFVSQLGVNGKSESRFIDICSLSQFCDAEKAQGINARKFLLFVGFSGLTLCFRVFFFTKSMLFVFAESIGRFCQFKVTATRFPKNRLEAIGMELNSSAFGASASSVTQPDPEQVVDENAAIWRGRLFSPNRKGRCWGGGC